MKIEGKFFGVANFSDKVKDIATGIDHLINLIYKKLCFRPEHNEYNGKFQAKILKLELQTGRDLAARPGPIL